MQQELLTSVLLIFYKLLNHCLGLIGRDPSFLISATIFWMSVCRGADELSCSALGKLRKTVPILMSFSCVG